MARSRLSDRKYPIATFHHALRKRIAQSDCCILSGAIRRDSGTETIIDLDGRKFGG
ncbi:molecular chaperone [Anopheles sinensis]|uniref:Molecular chaperone n=1 Tax=Anopheles sinensis TaxID=74873 RepID=A0A084VRK5_ANOSI|nr:molecular chaperone [Anopheles sinensis]